jgi:hypothetical protein
MKRRHARFLYALMDKIYVSKVEGKNDLGMKRPIAAHKIRLKDIKEIEKELWEHIKDDLPFSDLDDTLDA